MKCIEKTQSGRDFRKLDRDIINRWIPYMVVDGDFLRCIADHIANMTDNYAQEEAGNLYK